MAHLPYFWTWTRILKTIPCGRASCTPLFAGADSDWSPAVRKGSCSKWAWSGGGPHQWMGGWRRAIGADDELLLGQDTLCGKNLGESLSLWIVGHAVVWCDRNATIVLFWNQRRDPGDHPSVVPGQDHKGWGGPCTWSSVYIDDLHAHDGCQDKVMGISREASFYFSGF